jgi:hypothetical protein
VTAQRAPVPGTGVDGKPRAIDSWHEAGRESAFINVYSFIMAMRVSGFGAVETLDALTEYSRGNLMLTGGTWEP